ncbi:MAG: hypothetical protein GC171_00295 [Terrimonas sp.]|nr:hypothetical protein [Terrimonas sp.]
MSKILVPTDFSMTARNAIGYAIRMAKQVNAELVIFHANDPDLNRIEVDILKDFDFLKKDIEAGLVSPISIEYHFENGKLIDLLPKMAAKFKVDLVLMGTNGISDTISFKVGSNAYAAIEECRIPVLVVPPQADFEGINKIVLSVDYRQSFEDLPLIPLMNMLQLLEGELYVLSVIDKEVESQAVPKMDVQKIRTLLKNTAHSFHYVYQEDIEKAINDFCSMHYADMLITFPKNHSWVKKMFNNTHTQNLVYHIKLPVLAIHE